jgi:endoglucanase
VGFNSVRVPIRWSIHAGLEPPYEIDPAFFKRVDWVVNQVLSYDLAVVINIHHYREMTAEPTKHLPRLAAVWKQVALHYRDRSDRMFFELLNEPNDQLTDELWQDIVPGLVSSIRESNPNRAIIVGPGHWNDLHSLDKLRLPEQDQRLITTFHYYAPFQFTHQGASWIKDSEPWKGTEWKGSAVERAALQEDLRKAALWGRQNRRPLYLGEFGAFQTADMTSRALWTRAVAREAEKLGFSWSYWEFCSGFGAYDPKTKAWRQPLLRALMDH